MTASIAAAFFVALVLAALPAVLLRLDRSARPAQLWTALAAWGLIAVFTSGLAFVSLAPIEQYDFRLEKIDKATAPGLVQTVKVGHKFGSTTVLGLLSVAMAAVLARQGRLRHAVAVVAAFGAERASLSAFKHLVSRLRPEGNFEGVLGLSFPSGHSSGCVLVYGLLLLLLVERARLRKLRNPLTVGYLLFITFMGATRILGRAHWGLDVLSGFALGGFWLAMTVLVWNGRWCGPQNRPLPAGPEEPSASEAVNVAGK